ncbi:MAG: hypothetical protein KGZ74_16545, partial [Chitinophagaceae bacterium]|nr:hypothetical protein [Chitinophagaceae bacterium]
MSRIYKIIRIQIIIFFLLLLAVALFSQETRQLAVDKPQAIADLKTVEGTALINAKWFVQPAHVHDKEFRLPGPQRGGGDALFLYPTGKAIKTHTLHPQIGSTDFETGFREIKPSQLEERQGTGLFSFVWYKIELTLPSTIGKLNTIGTTAVLEITVDDYSEIWVNGKQAQGFGQSGNGLISGYNTRNRVLLTNNAKPNEKFTIHVLGINGPVGHLPDNYIWIRSAFVDFYKDGLPTNLQWKDDGKIFV